MIIYRIRIYDREGTFLCFADEDCLYDLKVTHDGKVNAYTFNNNYGEWVDVSSTHKIDWGILTCGKGDESRVPIYDGDTYIDWNTGREGKPSKERLFHFLNDFEKVLPDQFPIIEVTGNIYNKHRST